MTVIDPGHQYALPHLDGNLSEILTFVKREGRGYPGNRGNHPGTNIQEVLRAVIDRLKYLNRQVYHSNNGEVIVHLRTAIIKLEARAAERHGRRCPHFSVDVENMPVCAGCGHIGCSQGRCSIPKAEQFSTRKKAI